MKLSFRSRIPSTPVIQYSMGLLSALIVLVTLSVGADDVPSLAQVQERAEAYDQAERWGDALVEYVRVLSLAEDDETREAAGRRVDVLIALLREEGSSFDGEEFKRMRSALTEAGDLKIHGAAMLLGERLRFSGDSESAFAVFRRAAGKGHAPAMIQMGLMYSNGDGVKQDMEKASSWLRPANVKGDPMGKYLLAECFLYGKGVPQNQKLAVSLLEQALELDGPARALDLLATCYHRGWGVEVDDTKAVELYRDACGHGFFNACANLAVMYMRGDGVERSPARAIELLQDGVDDGNVRCMYFYAAAHLDGLGVEKDEAKARSWFRKSAEKGHPEAIAWCKGNGEVFEEGSRRGR